MLFHLFFHQNWPTTLENYSAISRRHPSETNPLPAWKIPVLVCFQKGLFYYLADLTHLILPEFQYLRDSAFNLSEMIPQCPSSWMLPDLGSLTSWCNWNCFTQKKKQRTKLGKSSHCWVSCYQEGEYWKQYFMQMKRSKLMKEVLLFLSYLHLNMFHQKPPLSQGSGRGKTGVTYYFEFSLNLFLIKLFLPPRKLNIY